MTTYFEVFPSKFAASTEDCANLEVWICAFRDAIKYNGIKEDEANRLFRLWLVGDAAKWRLELQETALAQQWKLDRWLKEMKKNYGPPEVNYKGDIWTLKLFIKSKEES
ncbi:hypothetical protein BB560_001253, partial [Smittium megazygosporum]